jgi:hypothetical protein
MAEFVDPHKVVARKCAFSVLPRAQNKSEKKKKKKARIKMKKNREKTKG